MSNHIKFGNISVPLDQIKFIKMLTPKDRDAIREKYGTDVSDRNISVTFSDKSVKTYTTTLKEVRAQSGLVDIGSDRHVIAKSIVSVQPFNEVDAQAAREKGITLNQTFHSRVTLTNDRKILSNVLPEQIMQLREQAMKPAA